jgi:hypothetical protein
MVKLAENGTQVSRGEKPSFTVGSADGTVCLMGVPIVSTSNDTITAVQRDRLPGWTHAVFGTRITAQWDAAKKEWRCVEVGRETASGPEAVADSKIM